MSNTFPLQAFLPGKLFTIPEFQRDYAWSTKEVSDLFSDIQDVLENGASHYLGTIVLVQSGSLFQVVDGQQRISTIILMLHAFLGQLKNTDPVRVADELYLLNDGKNSKLDFGVNQVFVSALLNHSDPVPNSRGQRRLAQAYKYAWESARGIAASGAETVHLWLNTIKRLEIIPFIETDSGRAIRIFQSVNNRGRPLTGMDKAKALLILYSNTFLNGALDTQINAAFGACFVAYDTIREQAIQDGYRIDLINRANFSEDDLLRYHYLAYDHKNADDYYGYTNTVLELFLKPTLRDKQKDAPALAAFISDYIQDIEGFARAFAGMVGATRANPRLFTILVVHGLAARLYPISVRLYQRNLLMGSELSADFTLDLLRCIEIVDLRIYKIRGTDPARDIGYLTHRSRTSTANDIAAGLRNFVTTFMPDGLMQTHLGGRMYKSGAVVPILLAFEQQASHHSLELLVELVQAEPTQEHIFPQTPSFDSPETGLKIKQNLRNTLTGSEI